MRIILPIYELGNSIPSAPAQFGFDVFVNGIITRMFREEVTGPSFNIGEFVGVFDTTLTDVSGQADSLLVYLSSPGSIIADDACAFGNGDSFIVGTLAASRECMIGECCNVMCEPPPIDTFPCLADIPEIPMELLDNDPMGGSEDSMVWVNTIGGMLFTELCDYFIQYSETIIDENTTPPTVTRIYNIYYDSAGVYTVIDQCMEVFRVTYVNPPTIECPDPVITGCGDDVDPEFMDLQEFLDAGGMVGSDAPLDSMSFMLLSETIDSADGGETYYRWYGIQDSCGAIDSCLHILVAADPTVPVCNDDIQISLDQTCEARITPGMILEGESGCGVYIVKVDGFGSGLGGVF
ncbi:MAG: hypothetical protein R3330_14500, partial [Saprospiraceae bacterium]|nr:hypothetical protein [Saprospiraceae bacterium]